MLQHEGMYEVAMYTPKQVAQVLMVSRSTIYDLVGEGVIPSVKIGRCRRIPSVAFHQFVDDLVAGVGD